jgi:hypothetical protein
MSQITLLVPASFPPGSVVQTITGNTGGAVGPDGTDNINIVGTGSVTVTGNPGTNTLTISDSAISSISITGDTGGAQTGSAFTFTASGIGLSFAGAADTFTLGGTLAIAHGGTNATSMANTDGVVYFDGTRLVTTAVGSATQVLTSNGAGVAPTFQPATGGSGITTINGDTGSVTGSTVTFNANSQAGKTVKFAGSGTTMSFDVTDANSNTTIGQGAASVSTITGTDNTALGFNALHPLTSGTSNTSIGNQSGLAITSGGNNTLVGSASGTQIVTTSNNTILGSGSYSGNGASNIVVGFNSLSAVSTIGSSGNNIVIGTASGNAYTAGESSNILIQNTGVAAESNVMRIGTSGSSAAQVNKTFIAGIQGVNVGSVAKVVSIASSGDQLGSATLTAGTGITITPTANTITITATGAGAGITINGDSGSVTGSTLTLTGSTSGAVFTGSGTTMTESFNYLALPTTTSTNGKITINSIPFFHGYGSNNVFAGPNAGNFTFNTTNGIYNTALGSGALSALTSASNGSFNTAIGGLNLISCTTGFNNSGFGFVTLNTLTTGSQNIGFGFNSLRFITSGSNNIGIGVGAGNNLTSSESNNIYIGNAGVLSESNTMRLGTTGSGTGQVSTTYIAGISGVTVTGSAVLVSSSGQLGIAVSSARFKENIQDMDYVSDSILKLRPVTFNYKVGEDRSTQTGLIAEEVADFMPNLVVYDKENLPQTVKYHELPVLLLNELQKALKRIEVLESKLGVK